MLDLLERARRPRPPRRGRTNDQATRLLHLTRIAFIKAGGCVGDCCPTREGSSDFPGALGMRCATME
jgi:hypothetical protein